MGKGLSNCRVVCGPKKQRQITSKVHSDRKFLRVRRLRKGWKWEEGPSDKINNRCSAVL